MNLDISLPLWMFVTQWILLFSLMFLVIVLYRQLGLLIGIKDAGTTHDGLSMGELVPEFNYVSHDERQSKQINFASIKEWSILLLAEPSCISCRKALSALEASEDFLGNNLQVLILTRADFEEVSSIEPFKTTAFPIGHVDNTVFTRLLRTKATPFFYLIT